MTGFFYWIDQNLFLKVQVQAAAKKEGIRSPHMGHLKIAVAKPPVDGKANLQLRRLLARELKTPVSRVQIVKGHKRSIKSIRIDNPGRIPEWLS